MDNILPYLQFGCLLSTFLMGLLLLVSKIHLRQYNHRYETSRLLLILAMGLYVVHYLLQMLCGFRQQGDEVGAVVNILFYAPTACLISYAMINIGCDLRYRHRFILWTGSLYAAILVTFLIGLVLYGSMHMQHAIWLMALLFFAIIVFAVVDPMQELHRIRTRLEEDTASDLANYDFFMRSGSIILYFSALLAAIIIFSSTLLFLLGPIILLCHFFYVVSFVCIGFKLKPVTEVMQILEQESRAPQDPVSTDEATSDASLAPDQVAAIEAALAQWQVQRYYSDPDTSIASMSRQLQVNRAQLSQFIVQRYQTNFRTWLSHIRLEEAKRMLLDNPMLSNEVVAEECGFTSRTYFQNLFKADTGLTPKEWRKKQ